VIDYSNKGFAYNNSANNSTHDLAQWLVLLIMGLISKPNARFTSPYTPLSKLL